MGGMNPLMTYMLTRGNDDRRDGDRSGRIDDSFYDRTGRKHYDNGRFAPMRSEYDGGTQMGYAGGMQMGYGKSYPTHGGYESPSMGYSEPVRMGSYDRNIDARRSWEIIENRSGSMEPEYNRDGMRRVMGFGGSSYVGHDRMDEMQHRSGEKMPGHAAAKGMPRMTREMAEEWMKDLHNEDGTRGPHWTIEQVKDLMQKKGIQCDPVRLWVAMNADYSDNVLINRKYGVDNPEFYMDSAIARWPNDTDAVEDKQAAYYMYVTKH